MQAMKTLECLKPSNSVAIKCSLTLFFFTRRSDASDEYSEKPCSSCADEAEMQIDENIIFLCLCPLPVLFLCLSLSTAARILRFSGFSSNQSSFKFIIKNLSFIPSRANYEFSYFRLNTSIFLGLY